LGSVEPFIVWVFIRISISNELLQTIVSMRRNDEACVVVILLEYRI
jgi:hypothetical protein